MRFLITLFSALVKLSIEREKKMMKKELVRLNEKQVSYNGLIFYKDVQGYYRNRKGGEVKLLHRYVYQTEMVVELAKGYVVHHIDDNKENNDLSNLQYMTVQDHMHLHGSTRSAATKKKMSDSQKRVMTQEKRDAVSKFHKGKTVSKETRLKIIEANTKHANGDVWFRDSENEYYTKINGTIKRITYKEYTNYNLVREGK